MPRFNGKHGAPFADVVIRVCTLFLLLAWGFPGELPAQKLEVPYVPTPPSVVEAMLELGRVGPGDYVIDLGSGDGRIVIRAGLMGAAGHGVDLDRNLVEASREKAAVAGVADRVMFLQEDIHETDISRASVITMYLLSRINLKLRPRLLEELPPGTRVVSHMFDLGDWKPDSSLTVTTPAKVGHEIFLWIVPAQADGRWRWNAHGVRHRLSIRQKYQQIAPDLRTGQGLHTIRDAVLRGRRISFVAETEGRMYLYNGRIEGRRIRGVVQIRDDDEYRVERWEATRR